MKSHIHFEINDYFVVAMSIRFKIHMAQVGWKEGPGPLFIHYKVNSILYANFILIESGTNE